LLATPPPAGYDGRPSSVPAFASSGPYAMGPPSAPTPGSGVVMPGLPAAPPGMEADAFAARLKPSILGLPRRRRGGAGGGGRCSW